MSHVLSVKFTDAEWEALKLRSERERLFPHGLVKISVRTMLDLPVPVRLSRTVVAR